MENNNVYTLIVKIISVPQLILATRDGFNVDIYLFMIYLTFLNNFFFGFVYSNDTISPLNWEKKQILYSSLRH